jgi:DNA topoisomerase-1
METAVMIGEKPNVASKLAQALGDYDMKKNRGVKNYIIETEDRRIIIAPAVGHIFNLDSTEDGWDYPVFDVEWKPTFETDDSADYMKKYYHNLQDQLEKADTYINACDFDLEGSVIGANVIKNITGAPDERIERMKFSTLTQGDLQEAFDNLEEFDRGMTDAGITRHILDYYYGVNVSRALMQSVRENDRYKTLSTGRVQGPALKVLADKEKEIMAFEPDDYWEIFLHHSEFDAKFRETGADREKTDRIWDEEKANQIFTTVKGEEKAHVSDTKVNNYTHNPPIPFNLTGLQKEASSQFNLAPKKTQSIAQSLYEDSLISYPRTESQKLPPKLGYKKLLKKLKNQDKYEDKAKKVLKKDKNDKMYPRQGKKEDDAHPAIYPTGEFPSNLSKMERKVYDLIVKRFFAVFGKAAKRQSLTLTLDVLGYDFTAKSKVTKERNWFDLYDPYVKVEEAELPGVEEGEKLDVEGFDLEDKETQPPNRYSQSGIVSELEKKNLGTKATRAATIDRLYNRNYIESEPIEVTELGLAIVETLDKHCPEVLSEELTREFEEKMEAIRNGEETSDEVVEEAREELSEMLAKFKQQEKEIGAELVNTIDAERKRRRKLGPCDECDNGTLRIIKSNGNRFVGCSNYPDCENTYPLPRNGDINSMESECDECGKPKIYVSRDSGNDYSMCIDPDCPSKDDW